MSKRAVLIPDTQVKKGVPMEHLTWAGRAIVYYKPDYVIHLGDHWDLPSLSSWDPVGSVKREGEDYQEDVRAGNLGFKMLTDPMYKYMSKHDDWNPERIFLTGNHEQRIERAINLNPKFRSTIGYDDLDTADFTVYPYLETVWREGIVFSHFFQNANSPMAISGTTDNRLNKIGESFVQGHSQGFQYGTRPFPTKKTRHGLVCGSFYQHDEDYKGRQGNDHWRGIVVLNEMRGDGTYDIMPLSMNFLKERFGSEE